MYISASAGNWRKRKHSRSSDNPEEGETQIPSSPCELNNGPVDMLGIQGPEGWALLSFIVRFISSPAGALEPALQLSAKWLQRCNQGAGCAVLTGGFSLLAQRGPRARNPSAPGFWSAFRYEMASWKAEVCLHQCWEHRNTVPSRVALLPRNAHWLKVRSVLGEGKKRASGGFQILEGIWTSASEEHHSYASA